MSENQDLLRAAFTAEWLMEQDFPPITYVVDGLITEGLNLLAAPPKLGKSWLVLDIALTVAAGARALGKIQVDRRPVLYLALEDGPRRLQNRLSKLGCAIGSPDLEFIVQLEANALVTIQDYLAARSAERPLVIVDTLQKVRGTYNGNDRYGHDYAQLSALKDAVDRTPGSSMLVVHHTRKGAAEDFIDTISGTQGVAGAADTLLTLTRSRNDGAGSLNLTSRDAGEGQYAVSFADGQWTLDGATLAEAAETAQQRQVIEGLGDQMTELVEAVNEHPDGIRRKELGELLEMEPGTLGKNLRRAVGAGRIISPKRGLYTPATTATSAITPSQTGTENVAPTDTSATFTHSTTSNVAHVAGGHEQDQDEPLFDMENTR